MSGNFGFYGNGVYGGEASGHLYEAGQRLEDGSQVCESRGGAGSAGLPEYVHFAGNNADMDFDDAGDGRNDKKDNTVAQVHGTPWGGTGIPNVVSPFQADSNEHCTEQTTLGYQINGTNFGNPIYLQHRGMCSPALEGSVSSWSQPLGAGGFVNNSSSPACDSSLPAIPSKYGMAQDYTQPQVATGFGCTENMDNLNGLNYGSSQFYPQNSATAYGTQGFGHQNQLQYNSGADMGGTMSYSYISQMVQALTQSTMTPEEVFWLSYYMYKAYFDSQAQNSSFG